MTCELFAKFVPVTVIVVAAEFRWALVGMTPEIVGAPAITPKVSELLGVVPTETETCTVPPTERSEAGTVAVTWLAVTVVGVRAVVAPPAFHCTAGARVRPLPSTVNVKEADPTCAEMGEMELTWGPTKPPLRGTNRDQAPRPWVPATRVREGSWSLRESTATLGRAVPRVFQVQTEPVQDPWNAPRAVAA